MQSTQSKLSEREIAQAWAKITIIKWKKKLAINKVGFFKATSSSSDNHFGIYYRK